MKNINGFDYKKAVQTINYFARKNTGNKIDYLKVIKLVYLADRYCLRKYGTTISGDAYLAMKLGPVASSVKDIITGFTDDEEESSYANNYFSFNTPNKIITSKKELDEKVFSEIDIEALEFVFNNFGDKNARKLVDITHEYPEWKKYEYELKNGLVSREYMNYIDFFSNPLDLEILIEDKFKIDNDILEYSKEIYKQNNKLAEILS